MNICRIKEKLINILKMNLKSYRTNRNITVDEAKQIFATTPNATLIDVRSNQEYQEYHIDGAICIPYYEIARRIDKEEPNKNALIILYCQSGTRSKKALEILLKKGYQNVYHIKEGLDG